MNSTPLRIAVIGARGIPSSYSGVERVIESLYATMAERGHHVTVYGRPEYAPSRAVTYRGMRVVGTRTFDSRAFGTASQVMTSAVHILRERSSYDLVHTHALAAGLVLPVLKRIGLPVVSTIHGVDWQRAKWEGLGAVVLRQAERWIVRRSDRVIVISNDLARHYRETYDRETVLIPNATDSTTDRPCNETFLARFGVRPRGYVLCVARLVPEKRIEDLIAAFRRLNSEQKLVIVGGSSHTDRYVEELRALASDDSRIVFAGAQPRDGVAEFLRGAALYVLPSELEGMPIALLESLEAGLPSIVSRLAVHEEILACAPDYDLFFPPRDVDRLRDRIAHALAHIERYRAMAGHIQQDIRARYTWPAIAQRTEDVYRELLDRSATRR